MGLEFLEGNEAIARGAMKANCNFFAGYPITPASTVFHYMLDLVPATGGVAIQGEDEIASIAAVLGAVWGVLALDKGAQAASHRWRRNPRRRRDCLHRVLPRRCHGG